MSSRENCIYCGKKITTRSSEHVIHNALGGLLESEDICCPECNNFISKYIDVPFTKIFNPIIGRIDNFSKSNNSKSEPPYTGQVLYNGKTYNANIKSGKVVACPELSKELRRNISDLYPKMQIISYDFNLQNDAFRTGIAKIAFNYAMSQKIDFHHLSKGLTVNKNGNNVSSIEYNYNIIPFCPTNPVDYAIELGDRLNEPFHNMILFSQHRELWCYVNLFNTFQYYVLLSDSMPDNANVHASYAQTLQKLNRDVPDISDIKRPKDVMIIAQQYGVEPCMDQTELLRRITNAISKKSQITDISKIISPKIHDFSTQLILNMMGANHKTLRSTFTALQLYFQDDEFQKDTFRILTPSAQNAGLESYPYAIAQTPVEEIKKYTTLKFNNLNNYLEHCGR